MKRYTLLVAFAVVVDLYSFSLVTRAADITQVGSSVDKSIGDLRYVEKEVRRNSGKPFVVNYVKLNPDKFMVRLVAPNDLSGFSLIRYFRDENALAALNGGFIENQTPPTPAGLLQLNHEIVNALSEQDPVLSGLLCFSQEPKRIAIAPIADAKEILPKYSDCLQGGPLLLYKGKPYARLEELDPILKSFSSVDAARSFIAQTSDGELALGVTTPISLFSLREFLLMSTAAGGLAAGSALNLTGRRSAGLIVGEEFFRGTVTTLLPNAIVVDR
jgi:Phosphodiester glycosidase